MPPKTITVVNASGLAIKERPGNEEGFKNLIAHYGVDSLKDISDGAMIRDFEAIEDGGKYTLGQPQRQQETGELRCCSKCCELLHYVLK